MSKIIDFYFTPVSPWTYLGTPTLREIAARHGCEIRYKPVNIAALFASAGVKPLGERPEPIQKYRLVNLARWRDRRGMLLNLQPKHFPTSPVLAAKMIVAAGANGADVGDLSFAFMRACWAEERDVADADTARAIADSCGFDGAALRQQAERQNTQDIFESNTQEALGHGAWGSPSYVIDGELFWGQDTLELLDWRLSGSN